jgi:hypothetical protein
MQNGRIKGEAKKALRAVIEQYAIPVTLTPNQNIILRDVEPAWQKDVQATLEVGMKWDGAVGMGGRKENRDFMGMRTGKVMAMAMEEG